MSHPTPPPTQMHAHSHTPMGKESALNSTRTVTVVLTSFWLLFSIIRQMRATCVIRTTAGIRERDNLKADIFSVVFVFLFASLQMKYSFQWNEMGRVRFEPRTHILK